MKYNKFCFNILCIQIQSLLQTYSYPNSKLVSKVSFKVMGVCKDMKNNKKYVSYLNMIKLKLLKHLLK